MGMGGYWVPIARLCCRRQIDLDRRASEEENTNKLSVASSAFYLVQFLCDRSL
jgi:hypothetical protein